MLRLILVRHGETHWNRERRIQGGLSDTPLSETGKKQAERLARAFAGEKISAVYSSPLQRALDTAQAIVRPHGLEARVVPALREIDVGQLEGMLLTTLGTNLYQLLVRQQEGDWVNSPGGESLGDLEKRVWAVVENIAAEHRDNIILVSHYFVTLTIICRALGMPLTSLERLRVSPGSKSILDFERGKPLLTLFNDTCHLE